MKAARFRRVVVPSMVEGKRRPSTISTGYRDGCRCRCPLDLFTIMLASQTCLHHNHACIIIHSGVGLKFYWMGGGRGGGGSCYCCCGFCSFVVGFLCVCVVFVLILSGVVVVVTVKTGLNELQVKSRASLFHSKENMGTTHE